MDLGHYIKTSQKKDYTKTPQKFFELELAHLLARVSDEDFKKESYWVNYDGHVWLLENLKHRFQWRKI